VGKRLESIFEELVSICTRTRESDEHTFTKVEGKHSHPDSPMPENGNWPTDQIIW